MVFPARQKGISLFLALIALVVLSLAAITLFRSVDTGSLVTGNIAFKQATTAASDRTAEQAITWLQANNTGSTLFNNNEAKGYYANNLDADPTGNRAGRGVFVDWKNDGCAGLDASACLKAATWTPPTSDPINGYTMQYVINRICKIAGDPNLSTNTCSRALTVASSSSPKRGEFKYGDDKRFAPVSGPYYRIMVRTAGPKDTVSYTETYVYF